MTILISCLQIKFELLDAKPVVGIPEPRCCYTHINFTARSSKEDSQEQLFFAEIYHYRKRWAPSGFIVTCCEPLGSDSAGDQFSYLLNILAVSLEKNVQV